MKTGPASSSRAQRLNPLRQWCTGFPEALGQTLLPLARRLMDRERDLVPIARIQRWWPTARKLLAILARISMQRRVRLSRLWPDQMVRVRELG